MISKNAKSKIRLIDRVDTILRNFLGRFNKRSNEVYQINSEEYWKSFGYKLAIIDVSYMVVGYGTLVTLLLTLDSHYIKLPIIFITFLIGLFIRFYGNMADKMAKHAHESNGSYNISNNEFYYPLFISLALSFSATLFWYLLTFLSIK